MAQVTDFSVRSVDGVVRVLRSVLDGKVLQVLDRLEEVDGAGEGNLPADWGVPATEVYGLTSQLRWAAVSIASNIAEVHGRRSTGEFKQFLGQARGSLAEVETQILISQDLCYLNQEQSEELLSSIAEVGRIMNGLLVSLDRRK